MEMEEAQVPRASDDDGDEELLAATNTQPHPGLFSNDVLQTIFLHLASSLDSLMAARLVCKAWAAAGAATLTKLPWFFKGSHTADALQRKLRAFPAATFLDVRVPPDLVGSTSPCISLLKLAWDDTCASCKPNGITAGPGPVLRGLRIQAVSGRRPRPVSLDTGPLRDSFPELRTLELCGSFSSETYDMLYSLMPQGLGPRLTSLRVTGGDANMWSLRPSDLQSIGLHATGLTELALPWPSPDHSGDDEDIGPWCDSVRQLSRLTRLRDLEFGGGPLCHLPNLASAFATLTQLAALSLHAEECCHTHPDMEGDMWTAEQEGWNCDVWVGVFSRLPHLERLRFKADSITQALYDDLSGLTRLRQLHLLCTNFGMELCLQPSKGQRLAWSTLRDLALSVGDADLSALVLGTSLPQHLRQLRLSLKGMDYTPLLALSLGPNAEAGIASNAAPAGTSAAAAVVADGADVKGAESSRAGVDSSQGRGEEAQGELVQLSSGLLGGGSGLQVLAGLSGLEQLEMESKNVPLTDQVASAWAHGLTRLTSLTFQGPMTLPPGSTCLSAFTSLRTLKLAQRDALPSMLRSPSARDANRHLFLNAAGLPPGLQQLEAEGLHLTGPVAAPADPGPYLRNVHSLNITGCVLDVALEKVVGPGLTLLHCLGSYSYVQQSIARVVQACPRLASLRVSGLPSRLAALRESDWEAIGALGPSLTTLAMSTNELGEVALASLLQLTRLRTLQLETSSMEGIDKLGGLTAPLQNLHVTVERNGMSTGFGRAMACEQLTSSLQAQLDGTVVVCGMK